MHWESRRSKTCLEWRSDQLEARYPRLKGRTGAICTEDFARAHGAVIFNHSPP